MKVDVQTDSDRLPLAPTCRVITGLVTLLLCCYGIAPQLGGVTLRPEKILVLAALGIVLAITILRGGVVRIRKTDLLLGIWLLLSILSSLRATEPVAALKHTLDLGLSVIFFFIASSWRIEKILLTQSRPILLVGTLLGGGSLVVALLLATGMIGHVPFLNVFVMTEEYTDVVRIKMTMWEANLFGAVMMVFALVSLAEFRSSRLFSWLALLFTHAGLLLALSRGPLLGYLVGLLLYCHFLGFRRTKKVLVAGLLLVLLVGVQQAKWWGEPDATNPLLRSGTLAPRLLTLGFAIEDIKKAPFLGNGTYSFAVLHTDLPAIFGEATGWISILPVAILHDTGIVGLAVLTCFFLIILWDARSALKLALVHGSDGLFQRRTSAWYGAAVGMLVLSLTTSAYSLAGFWTVMAIVASVPRVALLLPVYSAVQDDDGVSHAVSPI